MTLTRCPECGKVISTRFSIHACIPSIAPSLIEEIAEYLSGSTGNDPYHKMDVTNAYEKAEWVIAKVRECGVTLEGAK